MIKFVSYVPDEAIEKDAQALLAEYAHARGVPIEAPIAIDDIIEKHLKIGVLAGSLLSALFATALLLKRRSFSAQSDSVQAGTS